jgi:hypothetical protein
MYKSKVKLDGRREQTEYQKGLTEQNHKVNTPSSLTQRRRKITHITDGE